MPAAWRTITQPTLEETRITEQLQRLRVEYAKAKTPLDRQIITLKARPLKSALSIINKQKKDPST